MSAEEIGRELFISENTVKTHLKRIYKRLGAVNAAHAVALAYTHGAFWKGELYKTLEKD